MFKAPQRRAASPAAAGVVSLGANAKDVLKSAKATTTLYNQRGLIVGVGRAGGALDIGAGDPRLGGLRSLRGVTARCDLGALARRVGLLVIPEEVEPTAMIRHFTALRARLGNGVAAAPSPPLFLHRGDLVGADTRGGSYALAPRAP